MDGDELSLNQLVIVHGGGTMTARGQYRLDTSRFAFDARAEGFQLEPVVLDDITVPITGRADFGFTGEGTLDATLVQGSITLSELSSDPIGLAGGTASATLRVTGPLGALAKAEVQVDLETFNATLADSPLRLAAPARLTYDAGGVSVDELGLVAEELRLEIDGRLAEGTDESLRGSLSGDLRGLTPVIRNAQLALLPVPPDLEGLGGRVDLRGSLSYDDAGLAGSADLAVDEASVALKNIPPATGIEVRASYRDGTLKLSRLRGSWQQAVLSAQATVPWASSMAPTTITARIDGMSAAVLAPLVSEETRERLELAVDAEIELELARFALDGLSGRLRLTRANASVAGMQLSQERTTQLDLSRGRLTVTDWSWAGQTNRLDGQGSLDLTRADGLDLDVRGALDLRMTNLLAPAVASSGLSNFELRLHGDPRDPLIDGTITIDGADARIATPGLVFTDLDGRLVLTGERLELVALNGLVNGGSLAVTGELHHDDFTITDGTLAIDARNVALEFPEGLQSELEARLSLEASGDSLALTGTATIVRGAYRDPISMTSRLLTAINPQTVTVRTGRDSSAVDRMSLDVAIVTDEDIIVDNNYGRFLIGFQLTGTPNSLQTDLSSEPALGQSDLVSLLLTGRTLHEAGNAGAEVARDQVLDYLSGELAGVAGRAVGLNELRLERGTRASDVRFDPGLVATETDPARRASGRGPGDPDAGRATRARASPAAPGCARLGSHPGSGAGPGPSDAPHPGTASARDPRGSPPAASRPTRWASDPVARVPRPSPASARASVGRSAPTASAPRPDTRAGSRSVAPWPRRSSCSSPRPPHRQREARLRGPRPGAQQLDLHRQLSNMTLGGIQLRGQRLPVPIFQPEFKAGHRPLPPRLQPVDLYAHLTRQRLKRFAPQQAQHHVPLPPRTPPLTSRQGGRPARRAVDGNSGRPTGSLRSPRILRGPTLRSPHLPTSLDRPILSKSVSKKTGAL